MGLANNHICLSEDLTWDVKANGRGGLQIDVQKILGCLHRQVAWLYPFENLVC
jgi:hypothetical protein